MIFVRQNIRKPWLFWPVVIVVCMIISFCLDWPVRELVRWASVRSLPGDVKRTLESFKEFGQIVALITACLLIFVLDKPRRRMLLRLLLGTLLAFLVVLSIKWTVPRLRPQAADPEHVDTVLSLGFYLGENPQLPTLVTSVSGKDKIQKVKHPSASEKMSFPSGHTAIAFAFAFGLAAMYPPARWIFYTLASGCAVHRLIFGAHWFSDVIASVFIGLLIARAVWKWGKTESPVPIAPDSA